VAENVRRFGFVLYQRLAEGTEEYHERPEVLGPNGNAEFEETRHFLLQIIIIIIIISGNGGISSGGGCGFVCRGGGGSSSSIMNSQYIHRIPCYQFSDNNLSSRIEVFISYSPQSN
jgi:hypothetical protein